VPSYNDYYYTNILSTNYVTTILLFWIWVTFNSEHLMEHKVSLLFLKQPPLDSILSQIYHIHIFKHHFPKLFFQSYFPTYASVSQVVPSGFLINIFLLGFLINIYLSFLQGWMFKPYDTASKVIILYIYIFSWQRCANIQIFKSEWTQTLYDFKLSASTCVHSHTPTNH